MVPISPPPLPSPSPNSHVNMHAVPPPFFFFPNRPQNWSTLNFRLRGYFWQIFPQKIEEAKKIRTRGLRDVSPVLDSILQTGLISSGSSSV